MQNDIQQQILGAVLVVLRPIARALLRVGVGFREFSEIAKTAFVDVAGKDYGLRGRPTNISRVAVMTGLTRKEVRRIRDKTQVGNVTALVKLTPMGEVLHRWHTEKDFITENGEPADLPFNGEEASFSGLVKRFGGDIPPGAMRTELKRIEAVEELHDGRLRAVKRGVVGLKGHDKLISGLVHVVYPAALALAHNTSTDNDDETWAHRSALTQYVRSDDLQRIRRVSADRANAFIESMDDFLAAYETLYELESEEEVGTVVGIGVFYFEEEDEASRGLR